MQNFREWHNLNFLKFKDFREWQKRFWRASLNCFNWAGWAQSLFWNRRNENWIGDQTWLTYCHFSCTLNQSYKVHKNVHISGGFLRLDVVMWTDTIKSLTKEAVQNQEWITFGSLLAEEEWYIVYFLFPSGKRTFWTSGHGHYRRNAAHLRSTLITDYTLSASLLCLSRFITNYFCTLVTQERDFFLSLPPTPQSPAVLLCWRDMHCTHAVIYTYTIVHFKFCLFVSYIATEDWWITGKKKCHFLILPGNRILLFT